MKGQIPVINCLRGLAATMVCFYHFVVTTTGYIDSQTIKDIFYLGSNGVHIFFVISGVVITLSMVKRGYDFSNWGNFMLRRIARIEPPYLASIIVAIIYFKVREYVPSSTDETMMPSVRDLTLHVAYLVPFVDGKWAIPTYWTLAIEFQFYLLMSLFIPFAMSINKMNRYTFYLLLILPSLFIKDERFFPVFGSLFLMGIALAFYLSDLIRTKEFIITIVIALILSLWVLPISNCVFALGTTAIIFLIPNWNNKILDFLGKISYSLYLLHPITGGAVVNFLSHRFNESYQKPIVIIFGYLIAVGCAYVFYLFVEKPSLNLVKKIRFKKSVFSPAVLSK
jgi:peptidoglycan/LPS O-acetylase OafA/YrhL